MKVTNKAPLMAQNLATIQKYLSRGVLGQVLFACLFISNAWALDEICGDGLDDATSGYTKGSCPTGWMDAVYGDGCDLKCPAPDQDADGYVTSGTKISDVQDALGLDCDDTDRTIYAGIYTTKGCNSGYYRKCQDDGTFTSCTNTELCEATGSGDCYYIDAINGDDTHDGLTRATAWKSTINFGYHYGSGTKTAQYHTLVPGDAFYFMDGTYNYSYQSDYNYTLVLKYTAGNPQSGTENNPIILSNYPGESPILANTAGISAMRPIHLEGVSHLIFRGLAVTNNNAATDGTQFGIDAGTGDVQSRLIFDGIKIFDIGGLSNDNLSCISFGNGHSSWTIKNSFFKDCYKRDNPFYGGAILLWLSAAGSGGDIVHHNVIIRSMDYSSNSFGVFNKHSNDSPTDYNIVAGNIIVGVGVGAQIAGRKFRIQHNLFYGGDEALKISGFGGPNFNKDVYFRFNTIINYLKGWGSAGLYDSDYSNNDPENLNFTDNVVVATNQVPSGEQGFLSLNDYGLDSLYSLTVENGEYTIDRNCYYSENATKYWAVYRADRSGFDDSSGWAATTFAGWKLASSAYGYDVNSFEENPSFDATQVATSSNCADKGWRTNLTESSASSSSSSVSISGRSRQACLLN